MYFPNNFFVLKNVVYVASSVTINWKHDVTKDSANIRNFSCHSDVAVLTVAFPVAVPQNPVVTVTGISSESGQQHCVVGVAEAFRIVVNSGLIVLESWKRCIDADSQWTDGDDQLLKIN